MESRAQRSAHGERSTAHPEEIPACGDARTNLAGWGTVIQESCLRLPCRVIGSSFRQQLSCRRKREIVQQSLQALLGLGQVVVVPEPLGP
jgi:hypothetical protein